MRRHISLIAVGTVSFVILGLVIAGCGGGKSKIDATPESTSGSTSTTSGATGTAPTQIPAETPSVTGAGFGCPAAWAKYTCPASSGPALLLTAPFRPGVDAEMMCGNIGFYTSGVVNDNSILFKVPPGTEILSPADGTVVSLRSMPPPHEYAKSISIGGMPFLVYVYFVGDIKVEPDALIKRGQVIGVSTGTFPIEDPTDSKLLGASVVINLLGYDSKMVDASSADLWVGGAPSCPQP